jgi:hypothetical protein
VIQTKNAEHPPEYSALGINPRKLIFIIDKHSADLLPKDASFNQNHGYHGYHLHLLRHHIHSESFIFSSILP